MASTLLSETLSVPLPTGWAPDGTTAVKVEIDAGTGNLTIDRLVRSEEAGVLASGALQYDEKQDVPTHTLTMENGRPVLKVKAEGGRRSLFHFPWDACNEGYDWQIHLNPKVGTGIMAHTGGGNITLDLAGMAVTHLSADTGGGNMDLVLPDNAAGLNVRAKTGAGNVTIEVGTGIEGTEVVDASSGAGNVVVLVPRGIPALIHAHSGLGKVIVDPQFSSIDKETFRSPGYDAPTGKLEITAQSGAGNVTISTK